MKAIAIVGSGRVGSALAKALSRAGHDVTIGSRDPQTAAGKWQGADTHFTDIQQAIQAADIVFNATPGADSLEIFAPFRTALAGKLLVDVANATSRKPDGSPGPLLYPDSSLAERLQETLPETSVVKTLNTMLFTVIENPSVLQQAATVFLSGNSPEAKQTVKSLLENVGWKASSILDLGPISSARGTEALIAIVPFLVKAQGFKPFALSAIY